MLGFGVVDNRCSPVFGAFYKQLAQHIHCHGVLAPMLCSVLVEMQVFFKDLDLHGLSANDLL
jgi:hypothetical protein